MKYLSPEWRDKLLSAGFPAAELCTGEAEEILRRLPKKLESKSGNVGWLQVGYHFHTQDLEIGYYNRKEDVWLWGGFGSEMPESVYAGACHSTLANAAAAMYCYLAENGLLPAA